MAQIRDSSIIRTPEVTVDPRFTFPDDVVDLKQDNSDEYLPDSFDDNEISEDDELSIEVTLDQTVPSTDSLSGEPESPASLSAPQTLTVIDQFVRITPDGTSFVDVLIEVEDVSGANGYEVRVSV